MIEEEWDICPEHWGKNFKCRLVDNGLWKLEEGKVYGKWLFLMDKITYNTCPCNADVRNILSGILEAERRNDIFRLKNKKVVDASPQKEETLRKFRECLDKVENKWNEKKEAQKTL